MTNYAHGKIYKIQGTDPADKCYVGSTTKQYLSQRMTKHVGGYKRWKLGKPESRITSFEIFDKYGVENCTIVLLENYVAKSKDELRAREQHYINTLECVNKKSAIQDPEYDRKYREANKDVISVKHKAWRDENADTIKENSKVYYDENKEQIKMNTKKYYEENKEVVLAKFKASRDADPEKTKQKKQEERIRNAATYKAFAQIEIKCEVCDCMIKKCKRTVHNKTKTHLANLNKA